MLQLDKTQRATRKVILYGAPGTLKTTTAAQFPKPLLIQDAVSRGADFLRADRVTVDTAQQFVQVAADLQGDKVYQSIVIDDFSAMVKRWVEAMPESREPRKAYQQVYKLIMPAFQRIVLRPVNVVVTTHYVKADELDPKTNKLRNVIEPNLPEALSVFACGIADVVAYCFNNGTPTALVMEDANDKRRIYGKLRAGLKVGRMTPMANLVAEVMK